VKKPTKSSASAAGVKKSPAKAKTSSKKEAKTAKPAATKKAKKQSLWDRLFKRSK
jgi:hypothetical protein